MGDQANEHYKKDGLIYTLPGIEYQVKLSMLLLTRALNMGCQFRIAAEREAAGKFDDLELEILDTNIHRLYQLKHIEDETKNKITTADLENMKDGRFSLPKYFSSYRQIKVATTSSSKSYELFIFTNIGLEKKLRENFEDTGIDKLLDMKKDKKGAEMLKLKKNCKFRDSLMNLLKSTSDLELIKSKLIFCIENGKDIDFKDKVLKKYQGTLLNLVFDEKNKQFRSEFLNENANLTDGAKELQTCLLGIFGNKLSEMRLTIKKCVDLRNPTKKFESIDLPNDKIDDEEITEFLDKLILAVNQPNEAELRGIIDRTMGEDKDINLLDNDLVANKILQEMTNWTKEKEGSYLTQKEGKKMFKVVRQMISKLVLIGPTRIYCEQLELFGITFWSTLPELEEFLKSSEQQILHLKNSSKSVFSSIKVHQTLKSLEKYSKDDSYIFSPLRALKKIRKRVLEAFVSSDLLIIELADSNDEMSEKFASDLSEILEDDKSKKLVLISSEGNCLPEDEFSHNILTVKDDKNSFCDLSEESQASLSATRKFLFQGYPTAVSKTLHHCIDADILFQMMRNENLEIGTKLPELGEVQNYYVPRKLFNILMTDSILKAPEFNVTDSDDVLGVRSDQDIVLISEEGSNFESLCTQFKNHTIHWIQKQHSIYVWKKSHGLDISKLRKHLKPNRDYDNVETILSQMTSKVIIITAPPGMGKSTEMTRLAKEFKESNPSYWVLRVNLVDCSTLFAQQTKPFDQIEVMQFLYKLLRSEEKENVRLLEIEWFQQCLREGKVIILLDGFDEICPDYNEKVIQLCETLKGTNIKQLWITTRPYGICTELENRLLTLPHSLIPLDHEDKTNMLTNVLKDSVGQDQVRQCAEKLINRFSDTTKDGNGEFFDNPLLLIMTAKVFLDAVHSNDLPLQNKYLTDTSGEIDLAELYQKFFEILFDQYIKERNQGLYDHRDKTFAIKMIKENRTKIEESYKTMAVYTLFGKDEFEKLLPGQFDKLQTEIREINAGSHKMGIVERVIDNKPIFVHRTFAEFFVALCLAEETIWTNPHFKDFISKHVFNNREMIISCFFVPLLGKNEKYKSNYPIHTAVFRNNESDLKKLLKNVNYVEVKDTLFDWTPLQCATHCSFWAIAEILIQMGSDSADMMDYFKKSSYSHREYVVSCAASNNLLQITKILYDLNRKELEQSWYDSQYIAITKDSFDVSKFLIIVCPYYAPIYLSTAIYCGALRIVKYILGKQKTGVNFQKQINLEPLTEAVVSNVLNIVEYLVTVENINFNIRNWEKETLLQKAVKNGSIDIVKCLVKTGKFDIQATNDDGESLVDLAKRTGSKELVYYLENAAQVSYASQNKYDQQTAKMLEANALLEDIGFLIRLSRIQLHEQDKNGQTLLHFAIDYAKEEYSESWEPFERFSKNYVDLDVVQYLVEEAKVDINKKNNHGQTALHLAIEKKFLRIVDYLITLQEFARSWPEFAISFHNFWGEMALHMAAKAGRFNIVQCIMENTIIDVSLENENGHTPLHLAVLSGDIRVIDYLLKSNKFDMKSKDKFGNTPLSLAIDTDNISASEILIWTKKIDTYLQSNGENYLQEMCKKGWLTIVKYLVENLNLNLNSLNNEAKTLLHLAAESGSLDTIKYLMATNKIDKNSRDNNGQTIIHLSVTSSGTGTSNLLRYLVENQVEINAQDNEGQTVLHLAASSGNTDLVQCLIEDTIVDVNLKDNNEQTPLHLAVSRRQLSVVKYLLSTNKFDLKSKDKYGNTLLKLAFARKCFDIFEILVSTRHFDTDLKNNGEEYLQEFCRVGRLKVVKYFVENLNIGLNSLDSESRTLLHLATSSGSLDTVKYLMATNKIDKNSRDQNGKTVLHLSGQINLLRYLVDSQVSVNVQDNNGQTKLHLAASSGNLDIVKYLIEDTTIDVNLKTENKQTPLHIAVSKGELRVVNYLLSTKKFDIKSKDRNGDTLLHIACKNGSFDIFKTLLDTKKFDNDFHNNGHLYLQNACKKKNPEIKLVRFLIEEANISINTLDSDRRTLLHLATSSTSNILFNYLFKTRKIDPNAKDNDGRTCLHTAALSGFCNVVNPHFGDVDVNAQDNNGLTALHIAVEKCNLSDVKSLVENAKIDQTILSNQGQTACDLAIENGMKEIESYLNEIKT